MFTFSTYTPSKSSTNVSTNSTETDSVVSPSVGNHQPNHLYVLQVLFNQFGVQSIDEWYDKLHQHCLSVFQNVEYRLKVNPDCVIKCSLDEVTMMLSLIHLCNGINLYNVTCNNVDYIPCYRLFELFKSIPNIDQRRLLNHHPQWFINFLNFLTNSLFCTFDSDWNAHEIFLTLKNEHFYLQQQLKIQSTPTINPVDPIKNQDNKQYAKEYVTQSNQANDTNKNKRRNNKKYFYRKNKQHNQQQNHSSK